MKKQSENLLDASDNLLIFNYLGIFYHTRIFGAGFQYYFVAVQVLFPHLFLTFFLLYFYNDRYIYISILLLLLLLYIYSSPGPDFCRDDT